MGGDYAPEAAVKGAVMALDAIGSDSRIVLFGDEEKIKSVLASEGCPAERFGIVATTEVIEMGDHPAKAFQSKADSSITVGFGYLAKGAVDGFASAGSTGAMMVGSMYAVKPIEGVVRPTISSIVPTIAGRPALLLDVGLNVDCKPEVLAQYGLIGSIYAEAVLGIERPRVAVLNIGEEETKGNAQTKATYELLKAESRINFVGNVEGSYLFSGKVADVIVCDGFVGNTALKMAEGLYRINTALGCRNAFWDAMNYENVGGTPVLGVITGVGQYLPEYILTNDELSRMVDTNDEWIMSHTGIKTRHILKGEGIGSSYMGARAVINLLDKTGVDPMEIDVVICATVTPDMFFPSTGNLIADQAGCKNAFAFDVSAACSGFLFALTTGAKFIEAGTSKKVIVVGADKMSSIVDYTDRSTCPLFGDAAAAVLLEANTEGLGIVDSILHSDGSGEMQLYMKAGGSRYPASVETVQNNWHTIMWDGHAVFKAAVSKMSDVSVEMMERHNLKGEDIRFLVPHQANLRIIDATARRMGITQDKCMINIDRNGNTTAATIPSCLCDYESQLRKGDNLILSAFGGGYTWGATYVKWAYDGLKA